MTTGYAYFNVSGPQQFGFVQQPQYVQQPAFVQQPQYGAQVASYGQHPATWSHLAASSGFSQQGALYPWAGAQQSPQSIQTQQCDPVEVFLQELSIQPSEEYLFAWIAEYGLQSRAYYVDADLGTSSWENPLTNCLRAIVEIGRRYLQSPSDSYFSEQKDAIWDRHKEELACWHGPLVDESGNSYFTNSDLGISSWHDPREETQFIFEIESNLLDALEDTLFGMVPSALEEDELPTFGGTLKSSAPFRTESGAEVWTLDQEPVSPTSPGSGGSRNQKSPWKTDKFLDLDEQRSTLEKMIKAADNLNDIHREQEEAQRLSLNKRVKERELRKKRIEEAAERAKRDEEALQAALAAAEEEKKAEVLRAMQEEQRKAEEALQKRLAEEEALRLEAERKAEEELEKEKQRVLEAERKAEAERLAEAKRRKYEAEKARQEEEARDRVRVRLMEVVTSDDVEALREAIAAGEAAGLEALLEPVRKVFKEALLASFEALLKSRDIKSLRQAIADAEKFGDVEDRLGPLRQALEEELDLRKAATRKARKAKEDLAAQFKDAKEAQDFGGAILVAQWRAAVREVAKPFEE